MRIGDLKMWKHGRNVLLRFPIHTADDYGEAAFMTSLWLMENFIDTYCEDKQNAVSMISEHLRKHIKGEKK